MGDNSYKGIPKTAVSSQPVDVGDADAGDGEGYDIDSDVVLGGISMVLGATTPNGNCINCHQRTHLFSAFPP